MIPTQKHSKGKGSKSKPKTDKSKSMGKAPKKANGYSGAEGSVTTAGRPSRPAGTPVAAPGGRNSRAKTYG